MALLNTVKVRQIDTGELLSFIQSGLGLTLGPSTASHSFNETFVGNSIFNGNLVTYNTNISGSATFASGFISNSGINVRGLISGQSLKIDNFYLNSGGFVNMSCGTVSMTGIPIYDSGSANVAVSLTSGTVFGVKHKINAPQFEYDASGNLMPATGLGTVVTMLCVSIGS